MSGAECVVGGSVRPRLGQEATVTGSGLAWSATASTAGRSRLVMNDFERGALVVQPRTPESPFIGADGRPWGGQTIGNFWSWAFSDLVANTTRGQLAEFIVGVALDALPPLANAWESYDLKTPTGIRVEVKASGLRQSWRQDRVSSPRFSVRPALAWDPQELTWSALPERNSDVYVFALHEEVAINRTDPLDLRQWSFRALATRNIDHHLGAQRTVGVSRLASLAPESGDVTALPRLVEQALESTRLSPQR